MGPWGLHYERTNTWWEMAGPWHEYLARCQFMLRQGRFVADVLYVRPEGAPQEYKWHERNGYDYDDVPAELLIEKASVEQGAVVLGAGTSYRVLVLPETTRMTPALLRKVKELAEAGVPIVGPVRPTKAPGLADYPDCDAEVERLARELWGLGGKVVSNKSAEEMLAQARVGKDFDGPPGVRWIHRSADGAEIYFVASNSPQPREAVCSFRVSGLRPELWRPETGEIEPVAVYEQAGGVTRIPMAFVPSGSVFVVFGLSPIPDAEADPVVAIDLDGAPLVPAPVREPAIRIDKAVYGVPGDPGRTRDVRAKLQAIVDAGEYEVGVSRLAAGDDPAYGVVKTLDAEYSYGGKSHKVSGRDPDTIHFPVEEAGAEPEVKVRQDRDWNVEVESAKAGDYELRTASGRILKAKVPLLPEPLKIGGPWEVAFPPNWGAPERVTMQWLVPWNEHEDAGVRHFSGTATYTKTFGVPDGFMGRDRRIYLDLGEVAVMASVRLNGKDLGILWKPPYRVEVTYALIEGANWLEIGVTNLWVNRMLGDEELPEDSDRNPDGTLRAWPRWVEEGRPSPTGRFTFTSWRLWKKGEPLVESGLIGPVTLRVSALRKIR